MVALFILLSSWLGAGVALGSAGAGLTVAAGIAFWWSIGATILTVLLGALVVVWGGLRAGIQGMIFMTLALIAVLILWSGLGILATHLITLGGGLWITLGFILWVISIITQVVSGVGLSKIMNS